MLQANTMALFLYSSRNLVGCIAGIIGLLAFFLGFIRSYWFFIVVGLYLCGYLMTASQTNLVNDWESGHAFTGETLKLRLESLIEHIRKRVPKPILVKVIAIKENILMLMPKLAAMPTSQYDLHVISQTVVDYLPHLLSSYLTLPPAFAKFHKLQNGKTAEEILMEQLILLDEQIMTIVISVNTDNAEALITQAAFLKDKFGHQQSWL